MLNIRFEAQDNQYLRVVTFPDGTTSPDIVSFRREWHAPEPYPWIRPLYELERQELVEEGKAIAKALLILDNLESALDCEGRFRGYFVHAPGRPRHRAGQ